MVTITTHFGSTSTPYPSKSQLFHYCVRFEVLTTLKLRIMVFCVDVSILVRDYHHFEERLCHHQGLQVKQMKEVCSSETMVTIYKSTWHHSPEHYSNLFRSCFIRNALNIQT